MKKFFAPFWSMGVLVFVTMLLTQSTARYYVVKHNNSHFSLPEVPLPLTSPIIISEFLADPATDLEGDANGDGVRNASDDEFIEILNTGKDPINISGWVLSDNSSIRHIFPDNTILAADCGIVVFGGGTPTGLFGNMMVNVASTGSLGLNNSGDQISLSDNSYFHQTITYGSEAANNQSLVRQSIPDGVFVLHSSEMNSGGTLYSPGTRSNGLFYSGCSNAGAPFAAVLQVDPLICSDQNIHIEYEFQAGTAPYSLRYAGNLYNIGDPVGTLEIPQPAGSETNIASELLITDIRDSDGTILEDQRLQVTPVTCQNPSNDFSPEDPCACNNDQSSNGAQDGSFFETISIAGTQSNQTWSISSLVQMSGGAGLNPVKLAPSGTAVAITEFMADVDGNEDDLEFVELFNYSNDPVDLNGFLLIDEGTDTLILPAYTLASGQYAIIVKENAKANFELEWFGGLAQANVLEGSGSFAIANSSDELILLDQNGVLLWQLNYADDDSAGRATFHTSADLSMAPRINLAIDRNGIDNNSPGFLGYQENDTSTDPMAFQSPGVQNNFGSPGLGNYSVINNKTTPIPVGTPLIFDPITNRHYLDFLHFDDSGYQVIVEGPNAMGATNNSSFTITNVCQYPTVTFDPGLSQGLPQNGIPVVFGFEEENNLAEDPNQPAIFEVNGVNESQFTPLDSLPGLYFVEGFFKADSTSNQGGSILMPANPGCETSLSQPLALRSTAISSDSCSCADHVIVSLDSNCGYELQLDQVSTTDACTGVGVLVGDSQPSNGNIIDCPGTFQYVIYDGENQQLCWGTITAEDKSGPIPVDTLYPASGPISAIDCSQIPRVLNQESSAQATFTGSGGQIIPNTSNYLGEIIFEDACTNCGCAVTTSFNDAIEYYDCQEVLASGTVALITRTWIAVDCNGIKSRATQEFRVYRPALEDLLPLADRNYQTCDPGNFILPEADVPFWINEFNGVTFLNEIECNYAFTVEDGARYEVCDKKGYKFERIYSVFDWCTGESMLIDTVLIKVGDFEKPDFDDCLLVSGDALPTGGAIIFEDTQLAGLDSLHRLLNDFPGEQAPLNRRILEDLAAVCVLGPTSTGPMDCTTNLPLKLNDLRDIFGISIVEDCKDPQIAIDLFSYLPIEIGGFPSQDSSWVRGAFPKNANEIYGLPSGLHALAIHAKDECYNSGLGVLFFEVEDLVKPVMKCNDSLRVTLVEGDEKLGIAGYAQVSTIEVDEGSWDNCELVNLEIRRDLRDLAARSDWEIKNGALNEAANYSPWSQQVEFFCADLNTPVEVQLRGVDANNNTSLCWLAVEVENGTTYSVDLEAVGAGEISCMDTFIAAEHYQLTTEGIGCLTADIEVNVDTFLNQCGLGYYEISIRDNNSGASKNASQVDSEVIRVNVVALHDYWLKFPADAQYYCSEDLTPGMVTSNYAGCDLLTIYQEDEIFSSVNDPDACYKIFRTYRVINWCEYDGESLPTVVSRDWDAHNGFDACFVNNDNDQQDLAEYNLNPQEPNGDGIPGDEDIYVIVKIDNTQNGAATVYYDNDSIPDNTSTANLAGDNSMDASSTEDDYEGYWWAVSRDNDCRGNGSSVWYDSDPDPSDIDGNDFQDDSDNRYGSFGFWQYTQHIVVYDDSEPEVQIVMDEQSLCSIDGVDCDADVRFSILVDDPCSTGFIEVSYALNGVDQGIISSTEDSIYATTLEDIPIGLQKLTLTVRDGCGNVSILEESFEVKDCKAPAPICRDNLVVELMPVENDTTNSMAVVSAKDLIASEIGDCTGQGPGLVNGLPQVRTYSINLLDSLVNRNLAELELNCDHANEIIPVEVHAWDESDNHDYCVVNIFVQNNNFACQFDVASAIISGSINTETAEAIEEVEVSLSGNTSKVYLTDQSGTFDFRNLESGHDYSIIPQKDENHRNGVSTFDLILIQKHILGIGLLDSPYKLIAADVNNSKSISTLDLIQLRKLILNIDTEFSNNTSWRFVTADYVFQDLQNPWKENFPEVVNINDLDQQFERDFIGIKIGDVNGSAFSLPRAAQGQFSIHLKDQKLLAGEEYTLEFYSDRSDVVGFQFTLDVNQAEIIKVIPGAAEAENFGFFPEEGRITTSFNGQAEGILFGLVLRPQKDIWVSEAININSRYTKAEAYTELDELLNVDLNLWDPEGEEGAFVLHQNTPNPFREETIISFMLPKAQTASVIFRDISGREVYKITNKFAKGYNELRLNSHDLPSAGVYFYTLRQGNWSTTKKLILSEAVNRR